MRKSIWSLLIIILLMLVPVFSMFAQPGAPPPAPGGGDVWIGGVPIGGGLVILMAFVMGYGARKLYNARKRKINE
jgi:hypothetical protein